MPVCFLHSNISSFSSVPIVRSRAMLELSESRFIDTFVSHILVKLGISSPRKELLSVCDVLNPWAELCQLWPVLIHSCRISIESILGRETLPESGSPEAFFYSFLLVKLHIVFRKLLLLKLQTCRTSFPGQKCPLNASRYIKNCIGLLCLVYIQHSASELYEAFTIRVMCQQKSLQISTQILYI